MAITFITPNKNGHLTTMISQNSSRLRTQQAVITMSGAFSTVGAKTGDRACVIIIHALFCRMKESWSILEASFSLLDGKPKATVNTFFCSQDHFYQWNNRKLVTVPPITPHKCVFISTASRCRRRLWNGSNPAGFLKARRLTSTKWSHVWLSSKTKVSDCFLGF